MQVELNRNAFQESIQQINADKKRKLPYLITGLDGSARAIYLAQLFQARPTTILIVESSDLQMQELSQDLAHILPEVPVLTYPADDNLAIEYAQASMDFASQRVAALNFLAQGQPGFVLTTLAGLRQKLNPVDQWVAYNKIIQVGQELDRQALLDTLIALSYKSVNMVMTPGEFSVRGGIVDFYPLDSDYPVRLDFFDSEVDSIRYFNAETQESVEQIDEVILSPVQELIFPNFMQLMVADELKKRAKKYLDKVKDPAIKNNLQINLLGDLKNLADHNEPLKYASAFFGLIPETSSLLDYLRYDGHLVINDYAKLQQEQVQQIEQNHYWIEQEIEKGQLIPNLPIKWDFEDLVKNFSGSTLHFSVLQRGYVAMALAGLFNYKYQTMTPYFSQMPMIIDDLQTWLKQGYVVQVALPSKKQVLNFRQALADHGFDKVYLQDEQPIQANRVNLVTLDLSKGFVLSEQAWALVTHHDLFKEVNRPRGRVRQPHLSNAEKIKSYNELSVGDYVVHLNHGVGRYTGMETLEMNGVHRDMLAIEYQNNARVLIPVDKIHLIQKYVSSESKTPKINKLGGTEWAKTKQKVQATVEDIADDLIKLYAKREAEKGYRFSPDTPEQSEFEQAFGFVETPDQLTSSQEIKADMEKSRPMDRLLVGDVGYGKTEVAMRAIFKAVMDGKQVAFLVPTTVLAQQHYNTLQARFNDWPFEIGLLSRFVSRVQQKETIAKLKSGAVSIVVGTHRILSKDIVFNDLGLLIVDEEQRFGVKHKERLKQLKAQVDVLTLTATPIPRTLHMSMIGIRDLSVIETPPNNRFPVQTYIMERNEGAIKTAIEREMARGGQCFYLYNRVATIYQRADEISQLVPQARVAVAHGQMSETELETVLVDFIQGLYDVLVTTTIIETGVDIPNANTLFVDHADKMGLSTLYQLRGRVGRTHRVAYAYLMYEPFKQLSEVSEKRLKAIREFTDLGSGFKIAMRDLSIRGAGNLLGKQQSGFIDSVGYDLYTQMLKEAVDQRKGIKKKQSQYESQAIEWNVDVDAYLPKDYIQDERQKINMYKAIQQIDSEEAYRSIQDQLIDRFGEFPDQVADLLDIALIKYYGLKSGIEEIKQDRQRIVVTYNERASMKLKGPNIFQALQEVPLKAEVTVNGGKLAIRLLVQGKVSYQWLPALKALAKESMSIVNQGEEQE
ncbi:transcription-repair coupling factor [Eremococcus coleocola]|uniref:Transcription-repair-coupling factor n=1 Tax=Eremococcus coleocola ACS-139-V-Col8 TaxID=908337 RepID=E4KMU1_9LACT|nr:transcription-repair coupling factor [Eremococcus coleocola]EFR31790.1 transcription-repair coupling factor [Eremococcus coleocola ACS-139-V-Col8]